ncbi:MAG: hypothetical protein KIC47_07470 [Clostridium sp.]|uniref:hypothetical protein n=1 Tax=Clostridium neonatale TaxID=137838 RepID=UPI001D850E71|nr:hypothetical protein [Clostridium sp.]CAI3709897.1 hypothetical protein CNEO4_70076 [Clostridium neonatale]
MNEIVESFKISLIEDGKSSKTIESYMGDVKAFIEFLRSKEVKFNANELPFGRKNTIREKK